MQIAILGRGVVGGGIVKLVEEAETPLLRKSKIKKILVHRDEQILDDQHTTDAYRTLGRWASDKRLEYTWWDAARQAKSIRQNTLSLGRGR